MLRTVRDVAALVHPAGVDQILTARDTALQQAWLSKGVGSTAPPLTRSPWCPSSRSADQASSAGPAMLDDKSKLRQAHPAVPAVCQVGCMLNSEPAGQPAFSCMPACIALHTNSRIATSLAAGSSAGQAGTSAGQSASARRRLQLLQAGATARHWCPGPAAARGAALLGGDAA